MAKPVDLLQGTLDMLILKAVSLGALHGYGVLLRIQQISNGRLEIQQGSLYPALFRLEHRGLIAGGGDRQERLDRIFPHEAGERRVSCRRRFQEQTRDWNRMTDIIAGVLGTVPEEL